jgi:hypothetical protein
MNRFPKSSAQEDVDLRRLSWHSLAYRPLNFRAVIRSYWTRLSTMKTTKLLVTALVGVGLALGITAQAKEVRVQLETLPHAVQHTIKTQAGTDKVLRVMRESENGKDVYEAIVNRNGKETAIQVDDTGHYLGTHEEGAEHKTEKTKKQ